ncbi:MAG: Holliday junction branch migration DNA helicase RuvB [Bdellovibrionales bacterium]|nr:Holliday junction branch migration DNA helicase RuvB [Bdellovibrionales bacterium]MBT3525579.1 Holliday junction branch migration DNA helicase RuvB [Bdellovibrionales bacterium]MBT7669570.1 Holliday junction branch migration DNA helicase RuvB [Bdellovibrionales bacterium]
MNDNSFDQEQLERVMEPSGRRDEYRHDMNLRPKDFSEYIGQEKIVKNIELMVKSARMRGHAMDHLLLSGPPGLGKTSLAMIISQALESEFFVISGPALEKKGDLAAILTNLGPRDVLFIDEIHRMHATIEEVLYSAMEDFRLDIVMGQGPAARTMQIEIAPFTLIGATTRSGLLSSPLRDRFMAHLHFDFYHPAELCQIIQNNAVKLNVKMAEDALDKISKCARGTPRIANRVLRRVRDFGLVEGCDIITSSEVEQALKLMEIDQQGLDRMDRKILQVIMEYYQGGPVGIDALCATLSEDRNTIEDVYEPYLLKEGFLLRTPRGREISEKSREHLQKMEY